MQDTYDSRTIVLHWATAVLVLGLWTAGQCIDFFPRGTPRTTVRSLHISFGVVLALLFSARVLWRWRGGARLPAADAGVSGRLAIGVHYLLYGLIAAVVLLGLASVWFRGDTLFNLFTVPRFDPTNKSLGHDAVDLHGLLANILLGLAAAHAAAALWHHWVLRDGVLRRMWPSLHRGTTRR